MRRSVRISAVAAASALVLAACGTQADNEDEGGGEDAAYECSNGNVDDVSLGLAYDVGGQGDQSFNDAAYAGVEAAQGELGDFEVIEGEASDGEPESAREDRLRQMADGGANTIIGVGFAYSEAVNAVSEEYPEVSFAVIDGFDPDDSENCNVAYLTFAEEQGSFLVGAAAAERSTSGTIGFVGGVNNELIKKFEAGYVAGATEVNPDIEVLVNYIEESDLSGFDNTEGGETAAAGQYDRNADVVYHAAGASGSGVFDAAVDAKKWAIGVDSDQYKTATQQQKKRILTSMLKRVDVATGDFIESVSGEPLASYTTYDLSADGVGYSTSGGYLSEETQSTLEDYKQQIVDGEIEVPTQP